MKKHAWKLEIYWLRLERGWSQKELAEKCGFQNSAICHWETGRRTPTLKNIVVLANVFNVGLDSLIKRF